MIPVNFAPFDKISNSLFIASGPKFFPKPLSRGWQSPGDFLSRSKWTKVLIANAFFIPDFDVILQEILFHERFYIWFWNSHFFLSVRKFQSANLPRIKPSFSGFYQRFEVKLYMVYDLYYKDILEYIYFSNSFRAQGNYWRTNRLDCL